MSAHKFDSYSRYELFVKIRYEVSVFDKLGTFSIRMSEKGAPGEGVAVLVEPCLSFCISLFSFFDYQIQCIAELKTEHLTYEGPDNNISFFVEPIFGRTNPINFITLIAHMFGQDFVLYLQKNITSFKICSTKNFLQDSIIKIPLLKFYILRVKVKSLFCLKSV